MYMLPIHHVLGTASYWSAVTGIHAQSLSAARVPLGPRRDRPRLQGSVAPWLRGSVTGSLTPDAAPPLLSAVHQLLLRAEE